MHSETPNFEQKPLSEFAEKAYLDYSMYVILDRALPALADGLKPVQRRIVYAMSGLGLNAGAKHRKAAHTIGTVLGQYHPHGDSACYEAMVLMAQSFSYRYPLIDGQGNWGSQDDPKSFAAMRYTEARMTPYAQVLLSELGQGTVDWQPNYDSSTEEPILLPARLPNVLLNGGTGIAVGMSTDIPPHNLREVGQACVLLLDEPESDLDAVMNLVPGPDYPTDAELVSPADDLRKLYETGNGSVRLRSRYHRENGDIVITGLPHQTSGKRIEEQVATQMRAKKLPWIVDLRDESDHENPTRLVLMTRSNRVDVDEVMSHLFATTDLERSYRVNLNMIGLDGRPGVRGLVAILQEWLRFRRQTLRRRLQHRLDKVLARLHILDGLLIAFLNIDEVIAIIRNEDVPKTALMARFGLSEIQAEAILEIKLRQLAKLEEIRIRAEQAELAAERDELQRLLGSESALTEKMRAEIIADTEEFGDERRSPIVSRAAAQAISADALVPAEPVTVILSAKGWVRAAKGHDIDRGKLNFKAGDELQDLAEGRSNQAAIFLDSTGRSYALPAHSLPSARGQGDPLSSRLNLPDGARFAAVLLGTEQDRYLLASNAGYGFVSRLSEMTSRGKSGKAVLTLAAGAAPLSPALVPELAEGQNPEDLVVAVVSNGGRLLLFPFTQVPELARGKGNKLMSCPAPKDGSPAEQVVAVVVLAPNQELRIEADKRHFTIKPRDREPFLAERGRRGVLLPRGLRRVTGLL